MGYELGPFCLKNSESDTVYNTETGAGWDIFWQNTAPVSGAFYKTRVCFVLLAAGRWRWSLLVVCVTMLVCLTVLVFYLLHDVIKSESYTFLSICIWCVEYEMTDCMLYRLSPLEFLTNP